MTITYRNGFRDRLAFAAYHFPRHPLVMLVTGGIFLFLTFESILPAARSVSTDRSMVVRVIAFVFVEVLLLFLLVAFWAVITVLMMISTRNKPLYCQRSLTLTDGAFITESEYGRSETRWSVVQKLARTRSHIFMYLSQDSAVIVPRRAFESATQWDSFYELCQRGRSHVV